MAGSNPLSDTSAAKAAPARRFLFGPVVFDEQTLELAVNGQPVELDRKPLEVLRHLLLHAGEVVTKDELAEACWPGRILSDTVLAKTVSRLREALSDTDQALIKTLHGYGYRLAAPVKVEAAAATAPHFDFKTGDSPPLRPLWKLEARLGAGGHGEAWLGRHEKTHEARVFKFALDGGALSSLKREITLYRLLHQTLGEREDYVRVLDWNLDEPPYFVEFEHGSGGGLPEWAESQNGLAGVPLPSRIAMAIRIAEALAACHSVGVLHKDLKPANVLVMNKPGGVPAIKLADFGSGSVLDPERLASLGITRLGFTQALGDLRASGTVQYLPPEVLAGQPCTVQADVYALGVILYQLVVADFSRPLASGWEQDVADELLREDIADATHGNPARRLADASRLAERLSVLGPRRAQKAREAEARRKAGIQRDQLSRLEARRGWMVASMVILAAGLWATLALYLDARDARSRADEAAATATVVSDFLGKDMFAVLQDEQRPVAGLTVKELLDAASTQVETRFANAPAAAAQVHAALGGAYSSFNDVQKSPAHLRQALALFQQLDGPGSAAALDAAAKLVPIEQSLGQLPRTLSAHAELLAQGRQRLGERQASVLLLRQRLIAYGSAHDLSRASVELRAFIADAEQAEPRPEALIGESQQLLGQALVTLGEFAEAEPLLRKSVERLAQRLGADHVRLAFARLSLGNALLETERYVEAEHELEQARGIAERWSVGGVSGLQFAIRGELGDLRLRQGRHAEAAAILAAMIEGMQQAMADEVDETGPFRALLAQALHAQGRTTDAAAAMREALATCERTWGAAYRRSQRIRVALVQLLIEQRREDEARSVLAAVEPAVFTAMPRHPMLAELRRAEGLLAARAGETDAAHTAFAEALAILEFRYGAKHWRTQQVRAEAARVPSSPAA